MMVCFLLYGISGIRVLVTEREMVAVMMLSGMVFGMVSDMVSSMLSGMVCGMGIWYDVHWYALLL
jgi:hypothetical protein